MNRAQLRSITKKSLPILLAVIFVIGALSVYPPFRRMVRVTGQTAIAHLYSTPSEPFPVIPTSNLTPLQQKIISLSRQEYEKKPISYDAYVLTYSQGVSEPWCADFASWIFMKAGHPFYNPNSGSWRIPGVYTLQNYFQSNHAYTLAGAYMPKTGDRAIYHTGEGHTNIVLSVSHGQMTTIGGNENGHVRIETQSYSPGTDGLNGFGILPSK